MATVSTGRAVGEMALVLPDEIIKLVESEVRGPDITEAALREMVNQSALQYFFGGRDVVTRRTDEGLEIHAVGMENCAKFIRGLTDEERLEYWTEHPDSWESIS